MTRYEIGVAESADGRALDAAVPTGGLRRSGSGWDSEMVEYPCVFDGSGRRYMLYNGNDYGRTGVGLAVLGEPGTEVAAGLETRLPASRAASSTASIMLDGSATPFPAMSNAVP